MKTTIAKHNGKYKTQRDNTIAYYIHGSSFVDRDGKVLFPASEIDKHEEKLFNRTTECFIATGSMFAESLYNAGIIRTPVDEIAYREGVIAKAKGKETRFHWSAHERFMDSIVRGKGYEFFIFKAAQTNAQIMQSIDSGFPVMCSIWIKSWYPSGRGHLVLIVGYKTDDEGNWLGYIVNDPFGDCLSKYKNHDGEKVFYPASEWKKMMASPEDQPRFLGLVKQI
jgi:hypothetical protein